MKNKIQIAHPRNWQHTSYFLIIFFAALILCLLSRLLLKSSQVFTITIYLKYDPDTPVYFDFDYRRALQIVFLGPVFGLVYYNLMEHLISNIKMKNKAKKAIIKLLTNITIILVILNSMGHVFHLGFDSVNAIDKSRGTGTGSYNGMDTSELFLIIWFFDEWLGHGMVMSTYLGYLVLATIAEYFFLETRARKVDIVEMLFFLTPSIIGIYVMDGVAAIKSESGFIILIGHVIFLIIAFAFMIRKKINPVKYPILLTMIVASIPVIIYHVLYIINNGFYPWYPFYSDVFEHL
ncbi:MAG: hypothetical protein ACTSVI_02495 [Promethearchaeota archaeon]